MRPIDCPQCGAPANVQPGQALYECPYCQRTFQTAQTFGAPPPMANPMPPPPAVPQIVILAPGGYNGDDPMPLSSPARGGGGFVWGLGLGLTVLVLGVGGASSFLMSGSGASLLSGFVWDGKGTLVCGGNDHVTVSGVNATLTGTAIEAGGNCHVKIVDSTLKAGTVVDAAGNADVTFEGGSIEGTTAVEASGNARVHFNGTKVTGPKKKSGNARVD